MLANSIFQRIDYRDIGRMIKYGQQILEYGFQRQQ